MDTSELLRVIGIAILNIFYSKQYLIQTSNFNNSKMVIDPKFSAKFLVFETNFPHSCGYRNQGPQKVHKYFAVISTHLQAFPWSVSVDRWPGRFFAINILE